jgi:hypothetical protein
MMALGGELEEQQMTIGKSSGRGGLAAALETGYLLMENAKFLIAFALLGMLLSAGYQLERFPPVYEATAKLSQADGLPASLTGERRQAFEAWAVRRAVKMPSISATEG